MAEKILLLHCAESGKKALAKMAQSGFRLPASCATFELACTGRINEVLLMETLENGFSGVLIVGCHRDNCRYLDGNLRAEKRISRVKALIEEAGIKGRRLEMVFVSPDEGQKLYHTIQDFTNKVKEEVKK